MRRHRLPCSGRRATGALHALAASVLLLAGCSDADGAATDGEPSVPSTAPPVSAAPTTTQVATTITQAVPAQPEITSATADPAGSTVEERVTTTIPAIVAPATTLPAAIDPLDDLDEDGTVDARCGTVDLGGGLVVETLCNTDLVPAPEGGVTPLPGLLLLPSPPRWDDLAGVDATVRVGSRPDGGRVVIYVLGSDTLFDSDSATVRSTAQPPLAAIVASITARFPAAAVTVRGAADSRGDDAANLALSQQRAEAVAASLAAAGIDSARMTAIGLGEAVPVALEANADGSVSDIGQQVNRRVEIVVG